MIQAEFAKKDFLDVTMNSTMTWSLEFAGDDDQDGSDFVEKRVERKALLPVKPIRGHIRERFMSPEAVEAEFGLYRSDFI